MNSFNVQLITGIRANMKNMLLPLLDKLLLRRRVIVETIVDQLKNISQIEHSRHRSPVNFVVNLLCGLIAYCRKPSLNLAALASESELTFLTLTAEAQRARRDKRKPLCVLGVSAVHVSFKWRAPARPGAGAFTARGEADPLRPQQRRDELCLACPPQNVRLMS